MSNHQKESLRETCLKIRKSISKAIQMSASTVICNKIFCSTEYMAAQNIGLYLAHNQEVDLSSLWSNSTMCKKNYFFPKIFAHKNMAFLQASNETTFIKNKFGILEPNLTLEQQIPIDKLDMIFIPIVAFDEDKNRIGMGCGYYDRYLVKNQRARLIGVAYEFQKHPHIPADEWDMKLDMIITEQATYR